MHAQLRQLNRSFIHNAFSPVSVSANTTRPLLNPSTNLPLLHSFDASADDVSNAVQSAQNAFQNKDNTGWANMSGSFRRDALLALANCMANNRNLFAECEALTGKPVADSLLDVDSCVETFKFFAGFADKMHGRSFRSLSNHHSFTVREPLGVCGLITSFNYPLLLASWKIAPALASGNTVVIKPAHQTPISTLLLASLAGENILPPGVLNVVLGDATVGAALANHSGIQKLSFTGSTRGGNAVAHILAGSGDAGFPRPGTFELGGKNAIIVCEDADLEASVDQVVDAAFSNSGQNCCAASRLLLHASIHDEFIEMLVDRVKLLKVGDAMDSQTRVGPLVDSRAVATVVGAIEKANSDGFHLACGGASVLEPGFFVQPTVFTGVSDTSSLALHEIFGPVLAVLDPFENVDEAIQRANATPYGLAAGIFTNSLRHANLAVSKLKAGFVWVNCYNDVPSHMPLGGVKASGHGKECGYEAIDEFTSIKSVHAALLS
ncbi:aldehyde dehydrogenase [Chytriomyces cf. hyalinus JEL632]|nr:aldehyde dehydrogenase [Chytriomyces cf. hyalinus JEL632]